MSDCPTCGASLQSQGCLAMARLHALLTIDELIAEDYVRPERRAELRNRALNLERGLGFHTDSELKNQQQEKGQLS